MTFVIKFDQFRGSFCLCFEKSLHAKLFIWKCVPQCNSSYRSYKRFDMTCKRGERVNSALYWPFRLVCMPFKTKDYLTASLTPKQLFHFVQINLILIYERFCKKNRFQTEAKGNWEITYWIEEIIRLISLHYNEDIDIFIVSESCYYKHFMKTDPNVVNFVILVLQSLVPVATRCTFLPFVLADLLRFGLNYWLCCLWFT